MNAKGEIVGVGDVSAQTEQVIQNIRDVLEASGSGLKDVVMANIFLTDFGNYEEMNKVYGKYFKANPPARYCVQCRLVKPEFLVEIAVDEAKAEVPFIAGINSTDPKISIELPKHAEQIGAAGLMFGPPFYDPPTREEIVTFYKMVAEATNLGICIYNNFFATGTHISLETLERLVNEVEKIIGIKEPVSDFEKIEHEIKQFGDRINILSDKGDSFEPYGSLLGIKGFVAYAYVNFLPHVAVQICEAIKKKDWLQAKKLEDAIYKVRSFMFKQPRVHYISRAKEGMEIMELNGGTVRPFRHPLSTEEKEELRDILKESGYLN